MTHYIRKSLWSIAVVLAVVPMADVMAMAQVRNEAADGTGSLAALTAEVRQLRLAVEESTRSQAQTQALSVYLSAQQSRILQVATRLDAARKELDEATMRLSEITRGLEEMRTNLLSVVDPARRQELERANQEMKAMQPRFVREEQQARARESELALALQTEEARWTDLISRLEQLIKK